MALNAALCADWSTQGRGREIYAASIDARTVKRVPPPAGGWTVVAALRAAQGRRRGGTALLGFDAPIGVPSSFLKVLGCEKPEWSKLRNFSDLLPRLALDRGFFEPVSRARGWRPARPFFRVPPGPGGRRRFEQAMAARAVDGLRRIDRLAKGLPVFIVSGIAGAVGGAAGDLWRGLGGLEAVDRPRLWPFEGSLDELTAGHGTIVAEIYPRLAYGVALGEGPPPWGRLSIGKSDPGRRAQALDCLAQATWVSAGGVTFDDLKMAADSDDAFDALFSAAAILRCLIEEVPLSRPDLEERGSEGGILCSGSVDLHAPERKFRPPTGSSGSSESWNLSSGPGGWRAVGNGPALVPPRAKLTAMIEVHPARIPGRWREGYALDVHTLSSTYVGDDEYGHPRFESQRSPAGELLYRLKYKGDKSVGAELVEAAVSHIRSWNPGVDALVPVPPSRPRAVQPVLFLGEAIATSLQIEFCPGSVRRTREVPQLKDVFGYDERWRLLSGLHEVDRARLEGRKVLLFDDLFRSGATVNSITAALYDDACVADVFALTVTKTRSNQ